MNNAAVFVNPALRLQSALLREGAGLRAVTSFVIEEELTARYWWEG